MSSVSQFSFHHRLLTHASRSQTFSSGLQGEWTGRKGRSSKWRDCDERRMSDGVQEVKVEEQLDRSLHQRKKCRQSTVLPVHLGETGGEVESSWGETRFAGSSIKIRWSEGVRTCRENSPCLLGQKRTWMNQEGRMAGGGGGGGGGRGGGGGGGITRSQLGPS
eukprot:751658-Hanusia_phi.AAC.1